MRSDPFRWPARCLLLAGIALTAPVPARADTVLKLTETATVQAHPDELAAELRAEASSHTAAAAQEAVNKAMARALDEAKGTQDVTAFTGAYSVWQETPAQTRAGAVGLWHASQSLQLSSGDGPKLLALVGSLQSQGLSVDQLAWRLTLKAETAAREEATRQALLRLRGRAEQAAAVLGLSFGSFKEVSLNRPPEPQPLFAPRAAAASAQSFAQPVAEPGPMTVTTTVEAEVQLLPPPGAGAPAR